MCPSSKKHAASPARSCQLTKRKAEVVIESGFGLRGTRMNVVRLSLPVMVGSFAGRITVGV